ncbi:MAG: serine/threonine-protein kinase [Verrucomicrobiota bacterium JB023]|nr:serine/threonine-protein kinase [Verrucomicrobiota bacterium JB023]
MLSPQPERCPQCTRPLHKSRDQSWCPVCVAKTTLTEGAAQRHLRPVISPAELAPLFPQLAIEDLLGIGGMGLVYRVRQLSLERLAALKVIPDDETNPAFAERFEREARSLARLNHPDIIQIYDHGRVEGWFYILMEYVEGPDLATVMQDRGKLPASEAIPLFTRLCTSLAAAHQAGIVHRDLKPANLLCTKNCLKIADFGLAKLSEAGDLSLSLTGAQDTLGTPYYMAPEQHATGTVVDERADIYALGVLLYQMLTGTLPKGRFKPASKLAKIPSRLDAIIHQALQPDPADRFRSVNELLAALKRTTRPWKLLLVLIISSLATATAFLLPGEPEPPDSQPSSPRQFSPTFIPLSPPKPSPSYYGTFSSAAANLLAIGAPDEGYFSGKSDEPGAIHLYEIGNARKRPKLISTLRSPSAAAGDLFGTCHLFSDDGRLLTASALAFGAEGHSEPVIHLFEAVGGNWSATTTLTFPGRLDFGKVAPRAFPIGQQQLVVTFPDLPAAEAILIYEKDRSSSWTRIDRLAPPVGLNRDSQFGFQCKVFADQLFISCHRRNDGFAQRSGALYVYEKDESGRWELFQSLYHPDPNLLSYFGLDFTQPAPGVLAVSAFGHPANGLIGTGSVVIFKKNPASRRWQASQTLTPSEPTGSPEAFGQQLLTFGKHLVVLGLAGSRGDKSLSSRAHFFIQTNGHWEADGILDSREKGWLWQGRALGLPHHLLLPSPKENLVELFPLQPPGQ